MVKSFVVTYNSKKVKNKQETFTVEEFIGKGQDGEIYKVYPQPKISSSNCNEIEKQCLILKIYTDNSNEDVAKKDYNRMNEQKCWDFLAYGNIGKIIKSNSCLIMNYAGSPILKNFETITTLKPEKKFDLCLQLLCYMKHLLEAGVQHDDFHFGNLLYEEHKNQIRIIDFTRSFRTLRANGQLECISYDDLLGFIEAFTLIFYTESKEKYLSKKSGDPIEYPMKNDSGSPLFTIKVKDFELPALVIALAIINNLTSNADENAIGLASACFSLLSIVCGLQEKSNYGATLPLISKLFALTSNINNKQQADFLCYCIMLLRVDQELAENSKNFSEDNKKIIKKQLPIVVIDKNSKVFIYAYDGSQWRLQSDKNNKLATAFSAAFPKKNAEDSKYSVTQEEREVIADFHKVDSAKFLLEAYNFKNADNADNIVNQFLNIKYVFFDKKNKKDFLPFGVIKFKQKFESIEVETDNLSYRIHTDNKKEFNSIFQSQKNKEQLSQEQQNKMSKLISKNLPRILYHRLTAKDNRWPLNLLVTNQSLKENNNIEIYSQKNIYTFNLSPNNEKNESLEKKIMPGYQG